MLEGNSPRFPWKPSTTMLTHRLKRTTEDSVSDRDEQPAFSSHPAVLTRAGNRPHPPRIFAPHGAPRVWGRPVADAKIPLVAGTVVTRWVRG